VGSTAGLDAMAKRKNPTTAPAGTFIYAGPKYLSTLPVFIFCNILLDVLFKPKLGHGLL